MSKYLVDKMTFFLPEDVSLFVLHTSKLTSERSTNIPKNLNYSCYDISYLDVRKVKTLIVNINPSAVVFFTYQSLSDFWLIKLCKFIKVKTILFDHGIIFGGRPGHTPVKPSLETLRRMYSFAKNIFLLLCVTRNLSLLKEVLRVFRDKDFKTISFDFYFAISEHNRSIHSKIISLSNTKIFLIGYPFFKHKRFDVSQRILDKNCKRVMYIHQPFVKLGMTELNVKEDVAFVARINTKLKELGFELLVRLHPSENMFVYQEYFKPYHIQIDHDELEESCLNTLFFIGHWSTALLSGLVLNRPVFVLDYPHLYEKYIHYMGLFDGYSVKLDNIDNLSEHTLGNYIYPSKEKIKYLIGEDNSEEYNTEKLIDVLKKID